MLETVAIILIILWALGLVSSYTMGGSIHILLVIAIIVVTIRLIQGKRLVGEVLCRLIKYLPLHSLC